jgi:hypothetical protein
MVDNGPGQRSARFLEGRDTSKWLIRLAHRTTKAALKVLRKHTLVETVPIALEPLVGVMLSLQSLAIYAAQSIKKKRGVHL